MNWGNSIFDVHSVPSIERNHIAISNGVRIKRIINGGNCDRNKMTGMPKLIEMRSHL